MDIVQFFLALWASLVKSVGGEALAILILVGFVVALGTVFLALAAFRKTEFYKQHKAVWELIDNQITDTIFLLEFGNVDLKEWELKAEKRIEAGESDIDPRMLYLLDRVQSSVKNRYGIDLDFTELYARAEHIFNEAASSLDNGIISSKASQV